MKIINRVAALTLFGALGLLALAAPASAQVDPPVYTGRGTTGLVALGVVAAVVATVAGIQSWRHRLSRTPS